MLHGDSSGMATYQIPVLQSFSFKSDQWESWLHRFKRFCEASGLSEKSEETQISAFIYSMGDQSEDILKSFTLSEEEAKKYLVISKFNNHFGKRRNIIYDRAKFNCRSQQEGESVEDFIYHVNALADHCGYGQLREEMVCDRIVVGIRDAKLSQKLQMDAELTLEKVTQLVRESETIKLQQATLHIDDTTDIGAVTRKPSQCHGQQHKQLQRPPSHSHLLTVPDVVKHLTAKCNVQRGIKSATDVRRRDTSKNSVEAR